MTIHNCMCHYIILVFCTSLANCHLLFREIFMRKYYYIILYCTQFVFCRLPRPDTKTFKSSFLRFIIMFRYIFCFIFYHLEACLMRCLKCITDNHIDISYTWYHLDIIRRSTRSGHYIKYATYKAYEDR